MQHDLRRAGARHGHPSRLHRFGERRVFTRTLTSFRVQTIEQLASGGVRVQGLVGATQQSFGVEADFVVCTVPLGVLQQPGQVTFSPPLPPWKQRAISRLRVGYINRIVMRFQVGSVHGVSASLLTAHCSLC